MRSLARKLNPDEHEAGDMHTIRLQRVFDVVTIFDAVNHTIRENDLLACFQTGAALLRQGVVLLPFPR